MSTLFPYSGLVPLHNACSYGHYEVTELLLKVPIIKFNPTISSVHFSTGLMSMPRTCGSSLLCTKLLLRANMRCVNFYWKCVCIRNCNCMIHMNAHSMEQMLLSRTGTRKRHLIWLLTKRVTLLTFWKVMWLYWRQRKRETYRKSRNCVMRATSIALMIREETQHLYT